MEKRRYMARSAVLLLLTREENGKTEVLLQLRQNTGYGDGQWDLGCSGHVEEGESMSQAMIREAKEELGICIHPEDLRFATITHKHTPETGNVYFNGFFTASNFEGTPTICEPQKCARLCWFDVQNLPDTLLDDRKLAVQNYLNKIAYSEYGWPTQNTERTQERSNLV